MGGCSTKPKTTEFEASMDQTLEDTIDEKGSSLQALLLEQATKLPLSGLKKENGNGEELKPFQGMDMDGLVTQKEAVLIEAKKETIEFLKERLVASQEKLVITQEKLVASQEKIFKESVVANFQQKIKEANIEQKTKEGKPEQNIKETSIEHNIKRTSIDPNINDVRIDQKIKEETTAIIENVAFKIPGPEPQVEQMQPSVKSHEIIMKEQEKSVVNALEIPHHVPGVKNAIEVSSCTQEFEEGHSSPRHNCVSKDEVALQQCGINSAYKFDSLNSRRDRRIHNIGKWEQERIQSPCHVKICQEDKNLSSAMRIEPLASIINFSPDIDEVWEKLASEFERQESLSSSCRS